MIRKAESKDAESFCHVIRTSIIELCHQDHQEDDHRLSQWLESKTVDNCKAWIEDTNSHSFVAVQENCIVGVSHIGHNGHLFLLYVLPYVKGKGIGSKLLKAAEQSVKDLSLNQLTLESTITSQKFYEYHGYHA